MHFCLVFCCFGMGGTETLMLRMARWLVANAHEVTILVPNDGPLTQNFPTQVAMVVDKRRFEAVLYGGKRAARDFLQFHFRGKSVDAFYAFSPKALWVAAALLNAQSKPSRCLAGVYMQEDYVMGPRVARSPALTSWVYPAHHLFHYHLPASCRFYMNEAVKQHLEARSVVPLPGVIVPLPVDGTPFKGLRRAPESGIIVSVGRLNRMKEYNLWMIDVVAELLQEGLDVRWEVYGDGPYRDEMVTRIRAKHLDDRISMKGVVAYEELGHVFARASVFVGMGTALIEAGFAGVPAILARACDTSGLSYGFLHDLPGYTCGEPADHPLKPVVGLIRQVIAATAKEYEQLSMADRQHAERFDLQRLMPEFVRLVEDAPILHDVWRPAWRHYVAVAYKVAGEVSRRRRRKRLLAPALAEC